MHLNKKNEVVKVAFLNLISLRILFKKIICILYFLVLSSALINCTNDAVISSLINNRMNLILKGTYESNSPYSQQSIYADDGLVTEAAKNSSSPIATDASNLSADQLKFYMDIAEIRLSTGNGLALENDPKDYYTFFARTRKLLCTDYIAKNGKPLDTCVQNNGIENLANFFEEGLTYPSSDVENGIYNHIAIYFRRLVTYPAKIYNNTGVLSSERSSDFDNREIFGVDIENDSLVSYQYGPTDDKNIISPRLFPLEQTGLEMHVFGGDNEFVLEVRIFLKNLWMKHIFKFGTTEESFDFVFIGPSDFRQNHRYSDITEFGKLGGNIILNARIYYPDNIGHIDINNTGTVTCAGLYYYSLVRNNEFFDGNHIPYAATKGGATATIKNLPQGFYDLYISCDQKRYDSSNLEVAGQDGFPESFKICDNTIYVQSGVTQILNLNCIYP